MYQIWDGFCAMAKLNGGRRSSATLTGMKQRHGVKDAQRWYSFRLSLVLHCSRRCKNLKMVEYHFISNFPLLNRQDNQCNVGSGLCPASLRWNRTVCLSQIGAGTQTKFRRMIADAKVGRSKHWRLNSYNRIMLNAVSNPLNSETIRDFERLLIASELIFLWFFHFWTCLLRKMEYNNVRGC